MTGRNVVLLSFTGILLLSACGPDNGKGPARPIILGDSSTIVTETDPNYLNDFVTDVQLQPVKDTTPSVQETPAEPAQAETQTQQPPATVQEYTPPAAPHNPKDGLDIPFKEAHVFIPGIVTRAYRNQNPEKANGVTYELTSGNLGGNRINIIEGTVTKVSQRYQTIVIIKNELGQLQLESLNHTTDWKPLKGGNNTYTIAIDQRRLESEPATAANIRNSINTAAKRKRLSRDMIRKWDNAASQIRSVNQRPLNVILRSVIWKIEGRNDKGRPFQKQIRIDIPIS